MSHPEPRPLDGLAPEAYEALCAAARRHLGRHGRHDSLDTTALVHEAWLKLAGGSAAWRDEQHFRAVAAVAMRHILIDRARARLARKHGGALVRVSLDDYPAAGHEAPETLLAIDAALHRLALEAPRLARLVELRFFGGLAEREIADALRVTVRTVQRDWARARLLLAEMLDT